MFYTGNRVEFSVGSLKGKGTLLGIAREFPEWTTWIVGFDIGESIWSDGKESRAVVLPEGCLKLIWEY